MKKVVVTGANGFIGTALCKALVARGIEVIAIIRDEQEDVTEICNLDNLKIVFCDMRDFHKLSELILDRNIDVFFHFAWCGSAGPMRGNVDVQLQNVQYTCDAVKACAQLSCRRFVFASSIMEYEVQAIMRTEASPGINTLYSSAKVAADYMVRTIAGDLGVDYVRAVISNIYGPGEKSPRLINTSLRKLLSGEHCSFSAGEQMYDFVYIDDAVQMFIALAEKGRSNKTYYIGSLNPRPLKEFLQKMKNQVNPEIKIGLGELPFEGVTLTYEEFDVMAVKNDTGYIPMISFEEGIRRTIDWMQRKEKNGEL